MKVSSRSLFAAALAFAAPALAAITQFECPPKVTGAVTETIANPSAAWMKEPGRGKGTFALEEVTIKPSSMTDRNAGGHVICAYDGLQTRLVAQIPRGCPIGHSPGFVEVTDRTRPTSDPREAKCKPTAPGTASKIATPCIAVCGSIK